jgi:triacylglycerol lipase
MASLKSALAVLAVLVLAAPAAPAAESPMPEEIAWKLLELGRVVDAPKTAAIYAPLQEKEPYQGVKVDRDIKYGAGHLHFAAAHSQSCSKYLFA